MRPDLYPNPEQFQPERFLERTFSPYEFIPFGGGPRRCLGAAFAMYELKMILTALLSSYTLAMLEAAPVLPARRGMTMGPAGGVRMMLQGKRLPPKGRTPKVDPLPATGAV